MPPAILAVVDLAIVAGVAAVEPFALAPVAAMLRLAADGALGDDRTAAAIVADQRRLPLLQRQDIIFIWD